MKKAMTLGLALLFAMGVVSTGFAASTTCTVSSVDGPMVTLDCGKKADDLAVGTTVKVKTAKKKAIEGC